MAAGPLDQERNDRKVLGRSTAEVGSPGREQARSETAGVAPSPAVFERADFPATKGWDRRVALANRWPSSAYKPTRGEINLREVEAIFKAYDSCMEYLRAHKVK